MSDVLLFIKAYLKKKGYDKAASELDEEIREKHPSRSSQISHTSPFGTATKLIMELYENEDRHRVLVGDYEIYRNWVYESIDMVRPELQATCFPLFVGSYILMIRSALYTEARQLWDAVNGDFIDSHAVEIRALSQFNNVSQLNTSFIQDNTFVRRALRGKFCLQISVLAFELLKRFLVERGLLSILYVLNSTIEFNIYQNGMTETTACSAKLEDRNSTANHQSLDLPKMTWGVMGKGPYTVEGLTSSDILPDLSDPYFSNILEKLVYPKILLRGRKEDEDGDEGDDDSGDALEPSVVFASFGNTYGGMTCLSMSRDAKQVVGGFDDSSVRVWSYSANTFQKQSENEGDDFVGNMTEILPRYTSEGSMEESSNVEGNSSTPSLHRTTSAGSQVGNKDGSTYPYTLTLRGHVRRVYGVSQEEYSGELRQVLSCSADETVRLWDTHLGRCVARYDVCEGVPWDVSMSPLGYYFLTANQCKTASLFSTDRLFSLRVFSGHTSDVTCVAWHPNMAYAAAGSDDRCVRLWDIRAKGECVRCFGPGRVRGTGLHDGAAAAASLSPVTAIQCSPCGAMLAAGYEDGTIALWDVPSQQLSAILSGSVDGGNKLKKGLKRMRRDPTAPVYSVAFSADSSAIVAGGRSGVLGIWNISPASRWSTENGTCPQDQLLISPHKSFLTKHTPVYYVGYGTNNIVYAGGAIDIPSY